MPDEGEPKPQSESRAAFFISERLKMARTPTGTIHSVATVLSTAKTITGISNAAEAVVSSVAHGFANGDLVLVLSSWGRLNYRAYRVKSVTADTFVLEGANTTNTDWFTPGQGGGSARKATTWVDLDRTMNHNTSGGEAKTVNVKFIESDVEFVLNDGFSAVQRTFEMDADMIGSPAYDALKMLSETNADTIVRRRAKTGAMSLIPAKVAFNEEETLTEGQAVVVKGTFNAQNLSTRYAA